MVDLSDFKRNQIFVARMVSVSVNKTAKIFGVSRGTVSKVKIAFEKENKTSSAKHKPSRKLKFSDIDRKVVIRKDSSKTIFNYFLKYHIKIN